MRKIVNSEQIDHCRDNGSDRELHRLLEAPAARFNIILLIIIVILGYYHYHHHHRHWHYHHHFCENIYEGTNLSDFDAEKELLNSAGEATSISQAWNCDYHKGCTAMPILQIFWTLNFEHVQKGDGVSMAFWAMFKTAELVSQCIPKRYHRYQTEQPLKLFASKTLWGL